MKNLTSKETKELVKLYGCVRVYFSKIKKETEKAVLASFVFENENSESNICVSYEFWVPKSILEHNDNSASLPLWFIDKNILPKYSFNN